MQPASRKTAALQITLLFVLPVFLLALGIIPLWYRFIVLAAVILVVLGIMKQERWTAKDAGLRLDNAIIAGLPYALFTCIAIGGLLLYATFFDMLPTHRAMGYLEALLMAIPLSIGQELIFRSFLQPKLLHILRTPSIAIFANAILFMLLHVFYPNPVLLLPLAFVSGIGWAAMYYQYPNLILLSVSHVILNFVTALMGFFILPPV